MHPGGRADFSQIADHGPIIEEPLVGLFLPVVQAQRGAHADKLSVGILKEVSAAAERAEFDHVLELLKMLLALLRPNSTLARWFRRDHLTVMEFFGLCAGADDFLLRATAIRMSRLEWLGAPSTDFRLMFVGLRFFHSVQ